MEVESRYYGLLSKSQRDLQQNPFSALHLKSLSPTETAPDRKVFLGRYTRSQMSPEKSATLHNRKIFDRVSKEGFAAMFEEGSGKLIGGAGIMGEGRTQEVGKETPGWDVKNMTSGSHSNATREMCETR